MGGDRVAAVEALVATMGRHHPGKGFSISNKLRFVQTAERGLCVHAKVAIQRDETLMVLPESARLGRKRILDDNDEKLRKKLPRLRRDIEQNGQRHQQVQHNFSAEDFLFAVSIMKVLSSRCRSSWVGNAIAINIDQAATWPSETEMRSNSWFYWDIEKVRGIWNQSLLWSSFKELRAHVQSTFDDVLYLFFRNNQPEEYIDTSLPSNASMENNKVALWNTFIYSLALCWSRAHEGSNGCPEMIPLVELFNGHSDRIDQVLKKSSKQRTVINLGIAKGYWPFIGGNRFVNECNLPCSAVYATRDIEEGEELILTYGDLSPTGFVGKYGSMPADFLNHYNIMSDVSMWTPPQFIPTEDMRVKCLEKSDYPLDKLRQIEGGTALLTLSHERDDVEAYRAGYYEPEVVTRMRQYLILAALADNFELDRNFNTGRLRGPLYESRVLPLMQEVADYNIGLLAGDGETVTSAEDVERASSGDVPQWEKSCLLARVAYRESLLVWRHAFGQRGKASMTIFDEPGENKVDIRGRCRVCGRSYPSRNCRRCRSVAYCSRDHQALDWKVHKSQCG